MTTDFPQLLTLGELAARLRVTRSTIWRMRRAGKLVGVTIGGRTRFAPEQVRAQLGLDATPNTPATTDRESPAA
jgi:excisionase family DNA binding protein